MKQLNNNDLEWAVCKLPKDLVYRMKQTVGLFIIAGGYLRYTIANERGLSDIDVFTTDKESASLLADTLSEKTKQFITDNAISLTTNGKSVQIIHKWVFNSAQDILNHFDFTVAQAAIWWNKDTEKWESFMFRCLL